MPKIGRIASCSVVVVCAAVLVWAYMNTPQKWSKMNLACFVYDPYSPKTIANTYLSFAINISSQMYRFSFWIRIPTHDFISSGDEEQILFSKESASDENNQQFALVFNPFDQRIHFRGLGFRWDENDFAFELTSLKPLPIDQW